MSEHVDQSVCAHHLKIEVTVCWVFLCSKIASLWEATFQDSQKQLSLLVEAKAQSSMLISGAANQYMYLCCFI